MIWLAITAVAFTSFARAQAGIHSATAYANPVFEFLAAHQHAGVVANAANPRVLERASARQVRAYMPGADTGALAAMLPVMFVGLVSPLSLISAQSLRSFDRPSAAPALPFLFQRPPPSLVL